MYPQPDREDRERDGCNDLHREHGTVASADWPVVLVEGRKRQPAELRQRFRCRGERHDYEDGEADDEQQGREVEEVDADELRQEG